MKFSRRYARATSIGEATKNVLCAFVLFTISPFQLTETINLNVEVQKMLPNCTCYPLQLQTKLSWLPKKFRYLVLKNLNKLLLVQQRVAVVVKLIHVMAMHFLFTERTSV